MPNKNDSPAVLDEKVPSINSNEPKENVIFSPYQEELNEIIQESAIKMNKLATEIAALEKQKATSSNTAALTTLKKQKHDLSVALRVFTEALHKGSDLEQQYDNEKDTFKKEQLKKQIEALIDEAHQQVDFLNKSEKTAPLKTVTVKLKEGEKTTDFTQIPLAFITYLEHRYKKAYPNLVAHDPVQENRTPVIVITMDGMKNDEKDTLVSLLSNFNALEQVLFQMDYTYIPAAHREKELALETEIKNIEEKHKKNVAAFDEVKAKKFTENSKEIAGIYAEVLASNALMLKKLPSLKAELKNLQENRPQVKEEANVSTSSSDAFYLFPEMSMPEGYTDDYISQKIAQYSHAPDEKLLFLLNYFISKKEEENVVKGLSSHQENLVGFKKNPEPSQNKKELKKERHANEAANKGYDHFVTAYERQQSAKLSGMRQFLAYELTKRANSNLLFLAEHQEKIQSFLRDTPLTTLQYLPAYEKPAFQHFLSARKTAVQKKESSFFYRLLSGFTRFFGNDRMAKLKNEKRDIYTLEKQLKRNQTKAPIETALGEIFINERYYDYLIKTLLNQLTQKSRKNALQAAGDKLQGFDALIKALKNDAGNKNQAIVDFVFLNLNKGLSLEIEQFLGSLSASIKKGEVNTKIFGRLNQSSLSALVKLVDNVKQEINSIPKEGNSLPAQRIQYIAVKTEQSAVLGTFKAHQKERKAATFAAYAGEHDFKPQTSEALTRLITAKNMTDLDHPFRYKAAFIAILKKNQILPENTEINCDPEFIRNSLRGLTTQQNKALCEALNKEQRSSFAHLCRQLAGDLSVKTLTYDQIINLRIKNVVGSKAQLKSGEVEYESRLVQLILDEGQKTPDLNLLASYFACAKKQIEKVSNEAFKTKLTLGLEILEAFIQGKLTKALHKNEIEALHAIISPKHFSSIIPDNRYAFQNSPVVKFLVNKYIGHHLTVTYQGMNNAEIYHAKTTEEFERIQARSQIEQQIARTRINALFHEDIFKTTLGSAQKDERKEDDNLERLKSACLLKKPTVVSQYYDFNDVNKLNAYMYLGCDSAKQMQVNEHIDFYVSGYRTAITNAVQQRLLNHADKNQINEIVDCFDALVQAYKEAKGNSPDLNPRKFIRMLSKQTGENPESRLVRLNGIIAAFIPVEEKNTSRSKTIVQSLQAFSKEMLLASLSYVGKFYSKEDMPVSGQSFGMVDDKDSLATFIALVASDAQVLAYLQMQWTRLQQMNEKGQHRTINVLNEQQQAFFQIAVTREPYVGKAELNKCVATFIMGLEAQLADPEHDFSTPLFDQDTENFIKNYAPAYLNEYRSLCLVQEIQRLRKEIDLYQTWAKNNADYAQAYAKKCIEDIKATNQCIAERLSVLNKDEVSEAVFEALLTLVEQYDKEYSHNIDFCHQAVMADIDTGMQACVNFINQAMASPPAIVMAYGKASLRKILTVATFVESGSIELSDNGVDKDKQQKLRTDTAFSTKVLEKINSDHITLVSTERSAEIIEALQSEMKAFIELATGADTAYTYSPIFAHLLGRYKCEVEKAQYYVEGVNKGLEAWYSKCLAVSALKKIGEEKKSFENINEVLHSYVQLTTFGQLQEEGQNKLIKTLSEKVLPVLGQCRFQALEKAGLFGLQLDGEIQQLILQIPMGKGIQVKYFADKIGSFIHYSKDLSSLSSEGNNFKDAVNQFIQSLKKHPHLNVLADQMKAQIVTIIDQSISFYDHAKHAIHLLTNALEHDVSINLVDQQQNDISLQLITLLYPELLIDLHSKYLEILLRAGKYNDTFIESYKTTMSLLPEEHKEKYAAALDKVFIAYFQGNSFEQTHDENTIQLIRGLGRKKTAVSDAFITQRMKVTYHTQVDQQKAELSEQSIAPSPSLAALSRSLYGAVDKNDKTVYVNQIDTIISDFMDERKGFGYVNDVSANQFKTSFIGAPSLTESTVWSDNKADPELGDYLITGIDGEHTTWPDLLARLRIAEQLANAETIAQIQYAILRHILNSKEKLFDTIGEEKGFIKHLRSKDSQNLSSSGFADKETLSGKLHADLEKMYQESVLKGEWAHDSLQLTEFAHICYVYAPDIFLRLLRHFWSIELSNFSDLLAISDETKARILKMPGQLKESAELLEKKLLASLESLKSKEQPQTFKKEEAQSFLTELSSVVNKDAYSLSFDILMARVKAFINYILNEMKALYERLEIRDYLLSGLQSLIKGIHQLMQILMQMMNNLLSILGEKFQRAFVGIKNAIHDFMLAFESLKFDIKSAEKAEEEVAVKQDNLLMACLLSHVEKPDEQTDLVRTELETLTHAKQKEQSKENILAAYKKLSASPYAIFMTTDMFAAFNAEKELFQSSDRTPYFYTSTWMLLHLMYVNQCSLDEAEEAAAFIKKINAAWHSLSLEQRSAWSAGQFQAVFDKLFVAPPASQPEDAEAAKKKGLYTLLHEKEAVISIDNYQLVAAFATAESHDAYLKDAIAYLLSNTDKKLSVVENWLFELRKLNKNYARPLTAEGQTDLAAYFKAQLESEEAGWSEKLDVLIRQCIDDKKNPELIRQLNRARFKHLMLATHKSEGDLDKKGAHYYESDADFFVINQSDDSNKKFDITLLATTIEEYAEVADIYYQALGKHMGEQTYVHEQLSIFSKNGNGLEVYLQTVLALWNKNEETTNAYNAFIKAVFGADNEKNAFLLHAFSGMDSDLHRIFSDEKHKEKLGMQAGAVKFASAFISVHVAKHADSIALKESFEAVTGSLDLLIRDHNSSWELPIDPLWTEEQVKIEEDKRAFNRVTIEGQIKERLAILETYAKTVSKTVVDTVFEQYKDAGVMLSGSGQDKTHTEKALDSRLAYQEAKSNFSESLTARMKGEVSDQTQRQSDLRDFRRDLNAFYQEIKKLYLENKSLENNAYVVKAIALLSSERPIESLTQKDLAEHLILLVAQYKGLSQAQISQLQDALRNTVDISSLNHFLTSLKILANTRHSYIDSQIDNNTKVQNKEKDVLSQTFYVILRVLAQPLMDVFGTVDEVLKDVIVQQSQVQNLVQQSEAIDNRTVLREQCLPAINKLIKDELHNPEMSVAALGQLRQTKEYLLLSEAFTGLRDVIHRMKKGYLILEDYNQDEIRKYLTILHEAKNKENDFYKDIHGLLLNACNVIDSEKSHLNSVTLKYMPEMAQNLLCFGSNSPMVDSVGRIDAAVSQILAYDNRVRLNKALAIEPTSGDPEARKLCLHKKMQALTALSGESILQIIVEDVLSKDAIHVSIKEGFLKLVNDSFLLLTSNVIQDVSKTLASEEPKLKEIVEDKHKQHYIELLLSAMNIENLIPVNGVSMSIFPNQNKLSVVNIVDIFKSLGLLDEIFNMYSTVRAKLLSQPSVENKVVELGKPQTLYASSAPDLRVNLAKKEEGRPVSSAPQQIELKKIQQDSSDSGSGPSFSLLASLPESQKKQNNSPSSVGNGLPKDSTDISGKNQELSGDKKANSEEAVKKNQTGTSTSIGLGSSIVSMFRRPGSNSSAELSKRKTPATSTTVGFNLP